VDEILNDILKTFPLEFQDGAKKMTADEFIISQHFNLGMVIRNKYFYRNPNREQLVKSLGNKKDYRFLDGDVLSRIVLEALWKKITTESKQKTMK
jgi:hypothetical protein